MEENTKRKNALILRKQFDAPHREFVFDETALSTFSHRYNNVSYESRLYDVSRGIVGNISDCFILYVIACLGYCTRDSLKTVLENLQKKHTDLLIPEFKTVDDLRSRLKVLFENGYLFLSKFDTDDKTALNGRICLNLDKSAHTIMNKALQKTIPFRAWEQVSREQEVIGMTAASYIAALSTNYDTFYDLGSSFFHTKDIGTANVSCEVKFKGEKGKYTVGFLALFLHFDTRIMTKTDYYNRMARQINIIKNFLYARRKEDPSIVCVCESNEDLLTFTTQFAKFPFLNEIMDRIYFTSEGAVKAVGKDVNKALIKYVPCEDDEMGFHFETSSIPILTGK